MKLVIGSDFHLHPFEEFATTTENGINSRLWDSVSVLHDMLAYCLERRVGDVLLGGDLTHVPGSMTTVVNRELMRVLAAFKKANIRVYVVDGNHDHADKAGLIHTPQALAVAGLCVIPGKAGWRVCYLADGLALLMFSYCDNKKLLEQRVENALKASPGCARIGLFHHGFDGARVGTSLEYVVREPIKAKRVHILDGSFIHVFSGHYHAFQTIANFAQAVYIGSPLEFVRSDRHQGQKGFLEYDTDKPKELKLIPVKRPRFVKLLQPAIDAELFKVCSGNFVDVCYQELPSGGWERLSKRIREAGARGIKPVPLIQTDTTSVRVALAATDTTKQRLKKYMSYKKPDKALDRQILLNAGLRLLGEEK